MMPRIQHPVSIKEARHCPACSGQSRRTSGIAFIISTSNNNKIVPFVPLDCRRPSHSRRAGMTGALILTGCGLVGGRGVGLRADLIVMRIRVLPSDDSENINLSFEIETYLARHDLGASLYILVVVREIFSQFHLHRFR